MDRGSFASRGPLFIVSIGSLSWIVGRLIPSASRFSAIARRSGSSSSGSSGGKPKLNKSSKIGGSSPGRSNPSLLRPSSSKPGSKAMVGSLKFPASPSLPGSATSSREGSPSPAAG